MMHVSGKTPAAHAQCLLPSVNVNYQLAVQMVMHDVLPILFAD